MVINHNMSAMYANRTLGVNNLSLSKDMEKLSSGTRINRAGDDASGLAVSEKMRSQIRGLNQASQNAQNGISFIQTTEGYLQETTDIIQLEFAFCLLQRKYRLKIELLIHECVE